MRITLCIASTLVGALAVFAGAGNRDFDGLDAGPCGVAERPAGVATRVAGRAGAGSVEVAAPAARVVVTAAEIAVPVAGRRRLRGGKTATIRCFAASLRWMLAQGEVDGGFRSFERGTCATGDIAGTSLALLVLLGDGSTEGSGPFRATVQGAVRWLVQRQQSDGSFAAPRGSTGGRAQALAAYALTAAYGLAGPERRDVLRHHARLALGQLLALQRDPPPAAPRDRLGFLGFSALAFRAAAEHGLGLPTGILDRVREAAAAHREAAPGLAAAVLLLCRTGPGREGKSVAAAESFAARREADGQDAERCLFASFVAWRIGGATWERWQRRLMRILKVQCFAGGRHWGSYPPAAGSGRFFATGCMSLTEQACYRYSRLLRLKL